MLHHRFQVTIDAHDPDRLARFWADALGYVMQPPPPGFDSWEAFAIANEIPAEDFNRYSAIIDPDGEHPRVLFQRVPEGKVAKNRVHLDVDVAPGETDPEARAAKLYATAERLTAAGATHGNEYRELGSHWIVLQDPEGNEFCIQ